MLCQRHGKTWKDIILKSNRTENNLVIFDQRIIRKSEMCTINKLTSKELYLIPVDANAVNATAQDFTLRIR